MKIKSGNKSGGNEWTLVKDSFKDEKDGEDHKKGSCMYYVKRLTTTLFFIGCAVGCYIQIHSVTSSYLQYSSVTKVKYGIPKELDAPALSVCFRYVDVLDLNIVKARTKINFSVADDEDGISNDDVRYIQTLVTLKDIFELTPNGNVFNSCITRYPSSYNFKELESEDCIKHFNIRKFYLQEFICYKIEFESVKKLGRYKFRNLAYALAYSGMFYSVSFNIDTFKKADYVKVILNPNGIRPFRSAAFAPSFWRLYDPKTKDAKYNFFTVWSEMLINKRLPPPFNTSCIDYKSRGFIDANDCIRQCLITKTKEAYDRYPYSVLIEDNVVDMTVIGANISVVAAETNISENILKLDLDRKPIVTRDLETNLTIANKLYQLEQSCSVPCMNFDCYVEYSMTKVTKESQLNIMTFQVNTPHSPSYDIEFVPKTKFIEYFIYVLSCFGIWYGLSVLSLNPFRYSILFTCCMKKNLEAGVNDAFINSVDKDTKQNEVFQKRVEKANRRGCPRGRQQKRRPFVCQYCTETCHVLKRELRQELNMIMFLLDATGHNVTFGRGHDSLRSFEEGFRYPEESSFDARREERLRRRGGGGGGGGRRITFSSRHRLPPIISVNRNVVYDPTVGVQIVPLN